MKIKICIFFILFIYIKLISQLISSSWYDTENGLPQNSVKDIIQDKYGFIWISTENGLVKYDGNIFQIEKNITPHNNRFTYFRGKKEADSIFNVNSYQENIVLLSGMRIRRDLKSKYTVSRKIGNCIYYDFARNDFFTESKNINYFISIGNRIYLLNAKSITTLDNLGKENIVISNLWDNYIDDIFCVDETIYIVSKRDKKIIKIDKKDLSFLKGNSILFDKRSKLYWSQVNNQTFIVRNNVLYKIFFTDNKFNLQKILNYDFNKEIVSAIFYDENYQIVFLGTLINGLNIIKINNFKVLQRSQNVYYSLLPLENDSFVCSNGDVFSFNGFIRSFDLKNANSFFLYKDNSQNIYAISPRGLLKFYKYNNYLSYRTINNNKNVTFFFKSTGFSCIAYSDEFGKNNVLAFYKNNDCEKPIVNYYFNSIINIVKQLNNDNLLIGTRRGLYLLNLKNNKCNKIKYEKEIHVRDIIKTRDGNLWIMTYGDGFFLYKNSNIIKMPLDELGRLSFAHNLQEDENGYFWISSNDGLFKVKKSSLLYASTSKNIKVFFYRYTKHDGFYTNEFNGGCSPCSIVLSNGYFAFPSMKGIVVFNPNAIRCFYPKDFYIKTIKFNDNDSSFNGNSLTLSNNFYNTEIYIDIPYYADDDNLVLEAKIDNLKNAEWEKLSSRKFLITKLDPGKYKLKIRVLSSDKGDYIYKFLYINVKHLFFQTFLFKSLLIMITLTVVFIVIKKIIRHHQFKNIQLEKTIESRTKKLSDTVKLLEQSKEKLRKEIKQQQKMLEAISHDIVSPAKYLSITTKKLYEMEEKDFHQLKKYFKALYRSSEEFYNFIKTLNNYAEIYRLNNDEDFEIFSLNEVIESKIILFEEIAKSNNTFLYNHIKKEVEINSNKNIINIVIHNLLDNAVKNTQNGFIAISVEEIHSGIMIIISDSGSGMMDEQMKYYNEISQNHDKFVLQKYGLGLHLVLQLLKIIDGELYFTRNLPKGTKVTLNIKKMLYE